MLSSEELKGNLPPDEKSVSWFISHSVFSEWYLNCGLQIDKVIFFKINQSYWLECFELLSHIQVFLSLVTLSFFHTTLSYCLFNFGILWIVFITYASKNILYCSSFFRGVKWELSRNHFGDGWYRNVTKEINKKAKSAWSKNSNLFWTSYMSLDPYSLESSVFMSLFSLTWAGVLLRLKVLLINAPATH